MATKRQAARPIDVEVLDAPASEDHELVAAEGTRLRTFLGGLVPFFKKAGEIERAAKERLDVARQLKAPTDAASDEKIQVFIRTVSTEIAGAEDHWSITTAVHGLHRMLTAARGRVTGKDSKGNPTGMLDQAKQLAQNLHNRYVEDAKRKAREEEDRLNREAEDRARQDREAELKRLEEEAVKAEAASPELSERERSFVDLVAFGRNSSDAARSAGYKNPDEQAARLLKTPKIVKAIDAKRQAAKIREQASATQAMPVQVEKAVVQPDVTRAAGAHDRTTHGAEITDEQALIVAVLDPMTRTRLGIPADIVMINPTKVNEYGKSLKELINTWPGVRHTKKTSTI